MDYKAPATPLRISSCLLVISAIVFIVSMSCENALAEQVFSAGFNDGFYIKSMEDGEMEVRLGGSFQADYRFYTESERADNRFDIRRARLNFKGLLTKWFRFGMEYEFQGNETNNLLDTYGEAVFGLHSLRFGQFKEPFSLQWQSVDKGIWFAERSMGYHLGPARDIGIMLYGSLLNKSVFYAAGVFNGDGNDGLSSGSEHDEPEAVARLVISPFKTTLYQILNSFQFGFSGSYATIEPLNMDLNVKTTGMEGINRSIYVLSHNTKFGVLQDAGNRIRGGLETAWTFRSFAVHGEYFYLKFTDLEAAGSPPADADFSSWYASALWWATGEEPLLADGVMKPTNPRQNFNPDEGTFGAIGIGLRFDHFSGDENWINPAAHVSVRDADAISAALNWVLFPMHRFIIDYTHTSFSDPIRSRVRSDGRVDYIDKENVVTVRFSIDF